MALTFTRSFVGKGLKCLSKLQETSSKKKLTSVLIFSAQMRFISTIEVSKNISLISNEKKNCKVINFELSEPQDKPLVVLISWLLAKKKYSYKYADIYLKQGFDVLNINVSPWQFLWPTKGTQMVAKDIVKFLDVNASYSPLLLHGFSVAAYLWGEALVLMSAERQKYDHIINRIVGQVWDSAADVTEIPVGFPKAVFPNNSVLQNTLKQYILYHLKTFDKTVTVHYVRSSQMFHTNIVRAPALVFVSKSDPIGSETSNRRVTDNWENMGMQVTFKTWENTPHVGHYQAHPKEYLSELNSFLGSLNIKQPSKIEEKVKASAKL
ncbi:transmembrane protein 53-B isoform X2 [Diabrotica virgifera virgifera]|nr:transmembrane protein 53-B isoform X2 [Diabrotica virgifera virgifera]